MTALVVLAVLVGALAQSVSGIGFSLVCVPFLVGALGAHEGVRLGVALSLLVNVGLLARYHRDLDWRGALLLLAPAAVATPMAAVAVRPCPTGPPRPPPAASSSSAPCCSPRACAGGLPAVPPEPSGSESCRA